MRRHLSTASSADNAEDIEKHVDDVKVEVEGGKDVLLWRQSIFVFSTEHQLRVKHQVLKQPQQQQQQQQLTITSAAF